MSVSVLVPSLAVVVATAVALGLFVPRLAAMFPRRLR